MTKKYLSLVFIGIAFFTILFGYFLKDLKFNYVFESFFPTDDPELAYYQEFEKIFENDNNYLLIGLSNDGSVFDSTFLSNVKQLTDSLEAVEEINTVTSLTNFETPVISKAGLFQIPLVHLSSTRLKADSTRLYNIPNLKENFINNEGNATIIVIRHDILKDKTSADDLVDKVITQLNTLGFDDYHVAGKTYAQGIFITKMQKELAVFLSASVLLVMVFLLISFRTWWAVLVPLIIVMLSTIWILGIMALTGKTLDILMVLLPTIMFVVGMSDVVHILTRYIEQLRNGFSKIEAVKSTVREVGLATFLTSLTTSIGFLTLLTASIQPIKEFGTYTALGVFIAYVVAFTLLPACLLIVPKPKISDKKNQQATWSGFLSKSFKWVMIQRKPILIISFTLAILSLFGISKIHINTYLIEDLPDDAPLKKDFTFFDKNFGGSRPFELTATVDSDHDVLDPEVIIEMDKLEAYLKSDFKAGNIISPVSFIKGVNQALNGGVSTEYTLPNNVKDWKKIDQALKRYRNKLPSNLLSEDHKIGRISMRVGDIGSSLSLKRTEDLRNFIKANTDNSIVKFQVTGTSNLIDKNNEYLAKNMFIGLGIAFISVALIAGFLFKSFKMIIITLVPNIIPLLIVAGLMGIFAITLKLSTSIIFTIAFGIAVDDTIHFTSKFRMELSKGKSILYALKRTYLSTGKAIVVTSIILSGGFFDPATFLFWRNVLYWFTHKSYIDFRPHNRPNIAPSINNPIFHSEK
ncbi:efflux RND transporter permease subunit [Fulvivirga ligni]|uniref:efflux RND transporter permease subunit n=1 Tax=Fulvivirga ligni TaxID=2904246 RepID=UPI001F15AA7C|nr:efflux RND transporter permease subunit [Fulvivirga ligni]UII19243.1 efflux RND transporter permease subunit [Fulvivirga ligni]